MLPYFAYGSNLLQARLSARTPSARFLTNAVLPGHRLAFHKAGSDDSAKCDAFFTGAAQDETHGVVYTLSSADKMVLDAIEGVGCGYEIKEVRVQTAQGPLAVFTYVAQAAYLDATQQPFDWYHRFVLLGARQRGFPASVLVALEQVPTKTDPDAERARANAAIAARFQAASRN